MYTSIGKLLPRNSKISWRGRPDTILPRIRVIHRPGCFHRLVCSLFYYLGSTRDRDRPARNRATLTAIVGTLWYGPYRVVASLSNLWHFPKCRNLLISVLSSYHRAALYKGPGGVDISEWPPLKFERRLRFAPWWSHAENMATQYWKGRVVSNPNAEVCKLSDSQLRSIARVGLKMALAGEFQETDVRLWCGGLVADQAIFPLSLLDNFTGSEESKLIMGGYEGSRINKSVLEHSLEWTDEQWEKLGTVMEGVRGNGLKYLRDDNWIQ